DPLPRSVGRAAAAPPVAASEPERPAANPRAGSVSWPLVVPSGFNDLQLARPVEMTRAYQLAARTPLATLFNRRSTETVPTDSFWRRSDRIFDFSAVARPAVPTHLAIRSAPERHRRQSPLRRSMPRSLKKLNPSGSPKWRLRRRRATSKERCPGF